jgi:GT2 family glycosyltransferase
MMFFDEPNKVDYAGAQIVLAGGGYQFGFGENDTAAYCNSRIVPSACGGAMVISKKTFFKLGAFDPKYFIYYEDVDLSWRAWLMGCEVWFLAPAIVYHKHGGTMGKSWTPFKVYLAKRNQLCNAFKNLEMQNFLITFMFSVCRAVIEVAGNLVRWKLRYAWAIVAGIIEMVVSIPALVPSRAYVQRHRVFSDRQMMDRGIIERRKISFRRKTG